MIDKRITTPETIAAIKVLWSNRFPFWAVSGKNRVSALAELKISPNRRNYNQIIGLEASSGLDELASGLQWRGD